MSGSCASKKYSHQWLEVQLGKGKMKGCMLSVFENNQEFFRVTVTDKSIAKNYFTQVYPQLVDKVFGGSDASKK
jgi:hypothetical protein